MPVAQNAPTGSARPPGLPDFAQPPVVETVLGVSFHEVPELDTIQLGRLWERHLAQDFPKFEEAPPYEAPVERFAPEIGAEGPALSLRVGVPPRRVLFSAGNDLLQVQRDWFAFNWRKTSERQTYVRYEAGRVRFEKYYKMLEGFLAEEAGTSLHPTQCEVTYVNHIDVAGVDEPLLDSVLGDLALQGGTHLPLPDDIEFSCHYDMGLLGETRGRLHVTARTATRRIDASRFVLLTLTARGMPHSPDLDGVLAFLDNGREWVVTGFDELTTGTMHERWGKLMKESAT
ncbi:TIGR04255 family protein [Candidatus Poriferisodalis sp.]|uniref:TIGR04255 family protein n=1 Tax=Candidatus Poriferisodalis sp. TaxID=3101277 RepID=UPI003C6F7A43